MSPLVPSPAAAVLERLGWPSADPDALPESTARFADGAQYRVEIPSVEGPHVLEAVLDEARQRDVRLHRVSQGSGIMMLTDAEIGAMASMCTEAGIELSLFVGPRAGWDTGATVLSPAGRTLGAQLRGQDQLRAALDDVLRACALGIRSVLIADLGLLHVLHLAKQTGDVPADLVIKISVQLAAANAVAVRVLADLGATTINVPTDLSVRHLAAIRQASDVPLDVYVEVPDNFGGFVRHYDIPPLVQAVAPVYLKFGLRNAPDIYPSGLHLESAAVAMGRERVRRAALGLAMLQRFLPDAVASPVGVRSAAGVPVTAHGAGRESHP
jgi:hypothetical protein